MILNKRKSLCQTAEAFFVLASLARFERAAFRLGGERSILLSYRDITWYILLFCGGFVNRLFLRKFHKHIYGAENFAAGRAFPFGVAFLCFFMEMFQKFVAANGAGNFFFCPEFFKEENFLFAGFKIHFFSFYKIGFPLRTASLRFSPSYRSLREKKGSSF